MAEDITMPETLSRMPRPQIHGWQFFVLVALLIAGLVGGWKLLTQAHADHKVLTNSSATLAKINATLAETRATNRNNALAFAVILDDLADAFNTPPAPDPARKQAVQGLCASADQFAKAAGQTNPQQCPRVG